MKTKITSYEDLSTLNTQTLDRVIRHEREVYGYKGYGEYAFCGNPDCRRVLSIDEIYGVSDSKDNYKPLDELEKNGCQTPDCPDCSTRTILIFDPQIFRPYLASLYRNAYGSLLTDETDAVRGACIFQEYGLREFFEGNMDYKESMDWEQFRDRTSKILGKDFEEDTPMVATNRVSVERPYRGGGNFIKVSRSGLNIKPENDDRPAFASVRFDGNVLPILQAIGYKQIHADALGTVALGIEELGHLRAAFNLPSDHFIRKFGPTIHKIASGHRKPKTEASKPKYYRDASLLDTLQQNAENKKTHVEALDREEITPELIAEISDTFRELYANEYQQYLFYPSEGKSISPGQVFGADDFAELNKLDALDLNQYRHPETAERPCFWHDPETVRDVLSHLRRNGQLSLSRSPHSQKIEAFTFGYLSSVREAFNTEEWRNPINYSGRENPERIREIGTFLTCLNGTIEQNGHSFEEAAPLTEDSLVYIWNQFGVMPSARRKGKMKEVSKKLANLLTERNIKADIGLLETQIDSLAHDLFQKAGAIDVHGALNVPGEAIDHSITLMAFPFKKFIEYFSK